ncbi:N-acetylmuramoyl-L-alanine amidase [Lacticaseibacillus zhaodongensis]|uniref:N-acetylmuramoyl-L-alanine amidase n=1 Tax=Lacticaseibacillus zhaodongensis TaxID=2668065 RepID=UPI0012D2B18C|nr:N-acetylmuramoyl-L-alanine amidase [Lacticaseibacillus zhaodongensis]
MKKNVRLGKWPLIAISAALLAVSAVTTTAMAKTNTISVKASILNVRQGPGLAYNVMGQIKHGSSLTVISERNSWYQVRLAGNKVGWVASWLVDSDAATTTAARVAIAKTTVNVHQYAQVSAKIVGALRPGNSVKVVYTQGNWSQIEFNGTAAWVQSTYLSMTGQTASISTAQSQVSTAKPGTTLKVTAKTNSYLRTAGGINATVVKNIAKGTELEVVKTDGEWYRVRTSDGKEGFIASWVVTTPNDGKTHKAATSLAEATIVIDPGHGGSDTGALSSNGKHYEKTYTLQVAERIAAQLRSAGANVVMTRSNDTYVDLSPRPTIAAKTNADAFISIHFDSTNQGTKASGHTTYYYSKSKDMPLADAINSATSTLPVSNRGVEFGNYEVLRDNTQPAVLLELGYINAKKDFSEISSPSYQNQVAADVVTGLNKYFQTGHHQ